MVGKEIVLVIPDIQAPFQHRDTFKFLEEVANKYNPTQVVCIGDEVDFHALSDYEHDPSGFSAGHELEKAIEALDPLYQMFDTVKSCISNHTLRPFRRAFSAGIPRSLLKNYREFLVAPAGWKWESYWIIDGVRYEHGHNLGGGFGRYMTSIAPLKNGRSTVFGHFHANAGIQYTQTPEKLLFGFNVGCLIDFESYAFAYAVNSKSRPVLGCGVINKGVPVFIPMLVNSQGRWNKKIILGG